MARTTKNKEEQDADIAPVTSAPTSPSLEEWRQLYELAVRFRKLAPWEWMYDSQLFGVQNPDTGEIGYCSVMGNLGELFAIAVYRDLAGLQQMYASGSLGLTDPFILIENQDCIMASFEDRDQVEKPDYAVIKQLGLRFRGAGAWPIFRSYLPGYAPWLIDAPEARFLIYALEQAIDVTERLQNNPDLLPDLETNLYLVRRCESGADGLVWCDVIEPAVQTITQKPDPVPADEAAIVPLRDLPKTNGILEMDLFHLPEPIQEEKDKRPVFPYLILAVAAVPHSETKKKKRNAPPSGQVVGNNLVLPAEAPTAFVAQLLQSLEQIGRLPAEIVVQRETAYLYLEKTAEALEIPLTLANETPTLNHAQESLIAFMTGSAFPFLDGI